MPILANHEHIAEMFQASSATDPSRRRLRRCPKLFLNEISWCCSLSSRGQAHDGRSSDEIFTGMLVRSRHDARVSAGGRDEGATLDRPCIALLLAGCQQPAVQRLYSVDEVGLGQAMKMTEGESSEIDFKHVL